MDLAEYIKQQSVQDIYKEAVSKEYRRSSVKDRLDKIQNDRRHTRDRLLNSIRNITHLSPITPTPNPSRNQSKVSKKVSNNNMREKLAKWRAEKEKKKLEEKKKIRPPFKVSHVPDRIELPPPLPRTQSKFAPVNHVFIAPKNIKPIEITKTSSSVNKPVERKLPDRVGKNDIKNKIPKTSSSLSKPVGTKLASRGERYDNKEETLPGNSNCLTKEIVPLAGQSCYQKSKITKSVIGKENKGKLKRGISTSKVVPRQDRVNEHLKQNTNQIVICESSTEDEEQKENMDIASKRLQSSSVSGIDKKIDSASSPSKTSTISDMEIKNKVSRRICSTDEKGSPIVVPVKRKTVGKVEQQVKEVKSKIVRFGSQNSVGSDDVFMTPIKINHHAGVLRIDEVNISLGRPASTKKYKTTPYKSLAENEIFYSDDEICLKSPAVRKHVTSLKSPDKHSTSGISTSDSGGSFQYVTMRRDHHISGTRSLFMSTSDSGTPGSIGAVDSMPNGRIAAPDTCGRSSLIPFDVEVDIVDLKASKPNEISESSGTRKSLETASKTRRISTEIFDSPSITMSLRTRLKKREKLSSQNVIPSVLYTSVLKDSESNKVSGSSSTRTSLKTLTKKRRSSSVKSANKMSESPANRKSLMRLLQKYERSTPSIEINASVCEGSQTKVKSVTTTPDVKNARLSSSKTPEQKGTDRSSVYVSPFVTISRGKNSARKEYHVRSSTGGTLPGAEATTSPKAGAQYFSDLLNNEIERIEVICHEWNEYKDTDIPEEAQNMIDVAVGQSKLLIAKKFNQFRRLIEQCRSGDEERTVTCQDLHGFWDMVFLQVQDVDKRFDNLKKLKENNWQEIITEKKVVRTKKQRKTKTQASSKIKEMIDAAKRKKAQELQGKPISDLPVILAEGVKVDQSQSILSSPRRSLTKPNSGVGRSLRASLLTNQLQQKRRNSSPGLVMMSVSQLIKSNDGLTPCKSILKSTQQSKSERRITKTVLFKEDLKEERRFEHH